jgi:hypothetical protein
MWSWTTAEPSRPCSSRSLRAGERLLGDVEDLLDDQADAAGVLAVDDDLHRVGRLAGRGAQQGGQPHQRQDLAAVLHDLVVTDALERGHRELLEAGDHLERDAHATVLAQADDEQGLDLAAQRVAAVDAVPHAAVAAGHEHVGLLRDGQHVEDQRDLAVAEDGRAGEARDALELLAERLDDDLLGVDHVVDDQAELPVLGLQDHDEQRLAGAVQLAGPTASSRSR